jgi:aspartate aminotransferase-like enzyme
MKEIYQTSQDVLLLTATGTGAMEASVTNLFSPGEKVITINAGKFGERWTKLAAAYGLKPVEIFIERGKTLKIAELEKTIAANKDAVAILFQAHETSTGVVLPTQDICSLAQKSGMLTVVDAITACGAFNIPMDAWGIDVMVVGSQKALMIPPGLAFISLSEKAWKKSTTSKLPRFYFDLTKERNRLDTGRFLDSGFARSHSIDS